jgi:hypothetical protein
MKKMSRNVQFRKTSDSPAYAGNNRFLLGLLVMIAGLYAILFSDFQGHGFGFFLIFASPFIIFKDEIKHQPAECPQR